MSVQDGVLLDEAALFTNAPKGSRFFWNSGDSSRDRQFVLVTTCLVVELTNNLQWDNHMKVDVYRADIKSNGTAPSSWTRVDYNRNFNDTSKIYSANINNATAGADVNLGDHPFAIAWKFVMRPYGDSGFISTYDNKSRFYARMGAPGLQETSWSSTYPSTADYDTSYKGKELLILEKGFRVAHYGSYKSDSPTNYVTFKQDTQIAPGHTVVFKP